MRLGNHQFDFPVYLAPMAGVSDSIFRRFCKSQGADIMVTEFVSAEGILHRNQRTARYVEFEEEERPLGVQLFGGDPVALAEAARAVVDWVQPDFIDLNFGCPVNKVVCRQGGSALLKDCPLLEKVASAVVRAVAPLPVTAKMRIGWSGASINATQTASILENAGVAALAVHGRTKEQGYSGEADWDVIGQVADTVSIPVIGNGDLTSPSDVALRRSQSRIAGVMIGRAAMISPWIFASIRAYLDTGRLLPDPSPEERWDWIRKHCELMIGQRGGEGPSMCAMRSRLMAYSRALPSGKSLRPLFSHVNSLAQLDDIAAAHLAGLEMEAFAA